MIEKLKKDLDHEIQWLKYYGYREDRLKLDLSKGGVYEQVISIGYTKRVIPLDMRCIGALSYEWNENTNTDNLKCLNERRNGADKLSPIELWVKLYPNEIEMIYNKLNE